MRGSTLVAALVTTLFVGHAMSPGRGLAQDVHAASAAFAEAQRAQLVGDHARAASLFELADQTAPSPQALRSAIRNHTAAENLARAATLSAQAIERYPDDESTLAVANETLASASESLGTIAIRCTPACSVSLDGHAAHATATESFSLFADPGVRSITASWPGRDPSTESVEVTVGGTTELELVAPEVSEYSLEAPPESGSNRAPDRPVPVEPESGGMHAAVFLSGVGLTLVAASLAIWSGVDTLDARDAYVALPTQAGYEDGVDRQWRTNGFFIGVGVLAVTSAVLAIFTDWDGSF